MKAIKYILILSVSLFVFNSCTKQVAGPAGPVGSQGLQGPSAPYAVTIDSVPNTYTWPGPNSNSFYTLNIKNVNGLTNPSTAIVEVYVSNSFSSLSTWVPLPAFDLLAANDAMYFYYQASMVTIEYTAQPGLALYFKVVVISKP